MNQMTTLEAGLFILFTGPFMGMLVGLAFLIHERLTNPSLKYDRMMKTYETPLKSMRVLRLYDDPRYGRMVTLVFEENGQSNYGDLRISQEMDLKLGQTIDIQTYRYLHRKAS